MIQKYFNFENSSLAAHFTLDQTGVLFWVTGSIPLFAFSVVFDVPGDLATVIQTKENAILSNQKTTLLLNGW